MLLQCSNRQLCGLEHLRTALENFDGPLDGPELAVGKPLEAVCEARPTHYPFLQLLAPRRGEAKRQTAPVLGIVSALDEAGANQPLNRPADRRSAAADAGSNFVQGRRLGRADRI